MRHGLMAAIAVIALALALGTLLTSWEETPPNSAGLPQVTEEGRASTVEPPDGAPAPGL